LCVAGAFDVPTLLDLSRARGDAVAAAADGGPGARVAAEVLAGYLAEADVTEPAIPTYSNLTAEAYPADATKVRDLLVAQVAGEMRFTDEVRALYEAGARVFVEVGPGRALAGRVERILAERPHVAVALDRPGD